MHGKRTRQAPGRDGGFTLVELVIAMVVTALMALAIFATFTAQNQLYRRQYDIGRTQQNLRLAMEIVAKDISMAGHGASVLGEFYGALPVGTPNDPLWTIIPYNDLNGDGRDGITLHYLDPNRDDWGFVDRSEAGGGVASDYRCETTALRFTPTTAPTAAQYDPTEERFDRIACASHSANTGLGVSYIWSVASVTGSIVSVVANTGTNDYDDYCVPGRGLPEEMTCSPLTSVTYYIDMDGDGNGVGSADLPYLMLSWDDDLDEGDDIPIAAGIEDLQIGYCNHFDGCGATWNSGWDINTWNFADLSRVRLRMTARSERQEEQGLPATAPPSLDSTYVPAAAQDTYHRRVAHEVITLRNARSARQIRDKY